MPVTDRAHAGPATLYRPPSYQELFRTIGRWLDQAGWRDVLLTEKPGGFVVSGICPGEHGEEVVVLRLTRSELHRLVLDARYRRGSGRLPRRPQRSRLAALQEQPGRAGHPSPPGWRATATRPASAPSAG